jgi:Fe2+ transport system protein FeoA
MLRYLSERGIAPGDRMHVRERQPFGGPLLVAFGDGEDRREHAIGGRLAGAMRVQLDREPARPGSASLQGAAPLPGSAA